MPKPKEERKSPKNASVSQINEDQNDLQAWKWTGLLVRRNSIMEGLESELNVRKIKIVSVNTSEHSDNKEKEKLERYI